MLGIASRRFAPRLLARQAVLFSPTPPLQQQPIVACRRRMSDLVLPPPPPTNLSFFPGIFETLQSWSTLFIKRTFQPSIIRKRRKTGFLKRQKTVGGRRILKRRAAKGRARLAGC